MLKKHSQVFLSVLLLSDTVVTAGAWMLAYVLRTHGGFIPLTRGVPNLGSYIAALPVVCFLSVLSYRYAGMYLPRREGSAGTETLAVFRGTVFALVAVLAISFFYRQSEYSRAIVVIFAVLTPIFLSFERFFIRAILRRIRVRGRNARKALVVGAGKIGQKLAEAVARNPWTGVRIIGYVDDRPERVGRRYAGAEVLGSLEDTPEIIEKKEVDQVFLAIPGREHEKLQMVMELLAESMVDVRLLPDFFSFYTLNREVGEFDGLPIIALRESPLYGWNRLLKRAMDIAFSGTMILFLSPGLLLLALLVKLTSPGPVFYKQERMGLGGDLFHMYKFRSMGMDAEKETGAVWAKENDPRRTRFGTFLRKTSLDELPQFLNVLFGDMSVVGPRPERPVFITEFKTRIPRYMFRHKMKAGITGWAQVNGWRGNTSLRKRIQYDLHYIEHWSIWFDVRIMFLTVFRGLVSKNAY
jgi:Undecaprenyl-phosphate glucose phosphotransferase